MEPALIDLFCGCSGFGLGARNAGFSVPLSIDIDPILTSSNTLNFRDHNLLLADIRNISGAEILKAAKTKNIEGIIGGPPCQGFSSIGLSSPTDPRRELIGHFFRIVKQIQPNFFIMENVKGLVFSKNIEILNDSLKLISEYYQILGPIIFNAADFGAATKRERVFIFGYKKERYGEIDITDFFEQRRNPVTVEDAISDLSSFIFHKNSEGFDQWRDNVDKSKLSEYAKMMRTTDSITTSHTPVSHKSEVTTRFSNISQGTIDPVGRYPRLDWKKQSPTLRAGTGPDKGSFQSVRPIHPSENRVITVREAARLQGFPDWFKFHPTNWHSFRMIGNSVSPIIASSLLSVFRSRLDYNKVAAE